MSQIDEFLQDCDRVAALLGIARATLSTRLLADGRRLDALAEGKDIGVRRMERARADLAALERGGRSE